MGAAHQAGCEGPCSSPSTLAQEPSGECQDLTRVCPSSAAAGTMQHSPCDSAAMEAFSTKDLIPQSLQTISESPQGNLGSSLIAFSCQNLY